MGSRKALYIIGGIFVLLILWSVITRFTGGSGSDRRRGGHAAPVEVAPIVRGPIQLKRTFSGTLTPREEFVVAPKVGGKIEMLAVDISDPVQRGQLVAELDNDEFIQAVASAEADLAVAKANLAEARSALEISTREIERTTTLRERGVTSDSQFDAVQADLLAKQAQLDVAKAQVTRAEAALQTAKIRLGYTRVTASWNAGDNERVVAERYVDQGQTVASNDPLILIVELDPLTGVIYVTEKDYATMQPGQHAEITTDAFPGRVFDGVVDRISPVFNENSRQARVELRLENPGHKLKPGMFIRATVSLDQVDDALIVPESALTNRGDRLGVFIVNPDGETVSWHLVTAGIRDDDRVQISGEGLTGRVVTLGQQLIEDGSTITIPADNKQSGQNQE